MKASEYCVQYRIKSNHWIPRGHSNNKKIDLEYFENGVLVGHET
jgi:hypothetical protein